MEFNNFIRNYPFLIRLKNIAKCTILFLILAVSGSAVSIDLDNGNEYKITSFFYSKYYEKCLKVRNKGTAPLQLRSGDILRPFQRWWMGDVQDMIVVEDVKIQPDKEIEIEAVCGNIKLNPPKYWIRFKIDTVKDRRSELARIIYKNEFRGKIAQLAMWLGQQKRSRFN